MSNPGSPGVSVSVDRELTKTDGVVASETETTESSVVQVSGSLPLGSKGEMDPFVRLDQMEVSVDGPQPPRVVAVKRRASTGILSKAGKSSSLIDPSKIKLEAMDTSATENATGAGSITPSIVKPRRPSVHFAVDTEPKMRTLSTGALAERSKLEGGSRKHRSRKEKLVCRSESPSDLGMDGNESRGVRVSAPLQAQVASPVVSPIIPIPSTSSVGHLSDPLTIETVPIISIKMESSVTPTISGARAVATNPVKSKPRMKRSSSGNPVPRTANSRKGPFMSSGGVNAHSGVREPFLKKKKVIEIVSPRKRKVDHSDILKVSSDPIFIRAANQPVKFKSKRSHHRFKFSRMSLNKTSHKSMQRGRHSGIGVAYQKHRAAMASPSKREPEAEHSSFPGHLLGELVWVLEEAEKEFPSDTTQKKRHGVSNLSSSLNNFPANNDSPSKKATSKGFSRRRVESEPTGIVGLDMSAPGSPSPSQTFYQFRKEAYFSPSPSYAAPGPSPRRRYSRRRHAKIHPPLEETNCYYQGHHCPNAKVPGSQFCEKHLDQGPSTGYNHCKFMKDGRQCGNIFSSYDATVSYCEQHSNQIAKSEFESRNPKIQPEPMKSIISKISKIYTEGLTKREVDNFEPITNSDILEVIEEPDGIQDLPLNSFTGGLLEEIDAEGERNTNPDRPDYDALKNAGYYTTEEIIQIHISKLKKLKALYQREKELEWLIRQHKYRFYKEGLEKLKQFGPRFTTNPYLINRNIELPNGYIEHQIQQYEAAKAILQSAYKVDGQKGLLRLKVLQKSQELAAMAKVSVQKQHDHPEYCDSETDADSDNESSRDRIGVSRHSGGKEVPCAYNDGYAIKACPNPPVWWSNYCFSHILSDPRQVQWKACGRTIGPDTQDKCKTACLKILEKRGCFLHAPLVLSRHKPMRKSEEELNKLIDSDDEEEEVGLEEETPVLENLVADECIDVKHLDEVISKLHATGGISQDQPDTSDSEETDEENIGNNVNAQGDGLEDDMLESEPLQA